MPRQEGYHMKRYHARRARALEMLGNKCAKCGSTERLQIDHIYWHEKTLDPIDALVVSETRFLEEMAKCQLLCHPCHIIKSNTDRWDRRLSEPGTTNQYV